MDNSGIVDADGFIVNAVLNGLGAGPWLGNIINRNGGTININNAIINDGTINNNNGGTISIRGNGILGNNYILVNDGTINNSAGVGGTIGGINNDYQIVNNADGHITNTGSICNCASGYYGISTITNSGTIDNGAGGRLLNSVNYSNGDAITNTGTITNEGDISSGFTGFINNNGGTLTNGGTLSSQGTINNYGGGTITNNNFLINTYTINNQATFTDSGGLEIGGGYAATFTNSGTFAISSGGALSIDVASTFTNDAGGGMTNSGTVTIARYGTLTNSGAFTSTSGSTLSISGAMNNSGGTMTNSGTITIVHGGALTNSATIDNSPGGVLNVDGTFTNSATTTNNGIINNRCDGTIGTTGTLTNSNVINNSGTINGVISGNSAATVACVPPSAPTSLSANPVRPTEIDLSWTAPAVDLAVPGSAPVNGYEIERSSDGGTSWSTINANTGTTSTTYRDRGLTYSTEYSYRVSALNGGTSPPSTPATATTLALLPAVITLTSNNNPSAEGDFVTFTASVDAVPPATATPGGTVTFYDGSDIIGTGDMSEGPAQFGTSSLSIGTHFITVSYSGDANFAAGDSSVLLQVVKMASTTDLTSSVNPSMAGQSVQFTAAVSSSSGTPTGTVQFSIDGVATGSPVPLTGGEALFSSSSLSPGYHEISASYSGDVNFVDSTAYLEQIVNSLATTVTVSSSVNPSGLGHSVTFTATISPTPDGGTVQFNVDGTDVGSAVSLSGGQATYSTSLLSIGTHTIVASYSGDANFDASTSDAFSQVVSSSAPTPPTVTGISPATGPSGTLVTITGSGFSGATAVSFGATSATIFTVVNSGKVTANAPLTGTGTVDITITTPGGTSAKSAADHFTFTTPPACPCTKIGPFVPPTDKPTSTLARVTYSTIASDGATYLTLTRNSDNRAIISSALLPTGATSCSSTITEESPYCSYGFSPDGKYFVLATITAPEVTSLTIYDIVAGTALPWGGNIFGTSAGWGFSPDGGIFVYAFPVGTVPTQLEAINLRAGIHLGGLSQLLNADGTPRATSWAFSPCGDLFMIVHDTAANAAVDFYYTTTGILYRELTASGSGKPSAAVALVSGQYQIQTTNMNVSSLPSPQCSLAVSAYSPITILVTDQNGLRTGYDPTTLTTLLEIPGSSYTGPGTEPQTVLIPNPSGLYTIAVTGTGTGPYTIVVQDPDTSVGQTFSDSITSLPYSATYSYTAALPLTATSVSCLPSPIAVGGSQTTCTATVSGGSSPTGVVDFTQFGTGSVTPTTASCTLSGASCTAEFSGAAAGDVTITGAYEGDANNQGSSGQSNTVAVTPASSTTTTLVINDATSSPPSGTETTGASFHDTATVTGVPTSTPSGTVTYTYFTNGGCTGTGTPQTVTLSGGVVPSSSSTGPLAAGSYSYQATYSGDSNYSGNTSGCEQLTILQAGLTISTTLNAGATPALGAPVSDTATATGQVSGFTPSGTVTITLYNGNGCAGTVIGAPQTGLALGTASTATTSLAAGSYSYQASAYTGDPNYVGAGYACENFAVQQNTPTVATLVSSSGTITIGGSATDTATLSGAFSPTGSITYSVFTNSGCTTAVPTGSAAGQYTPDVVSANGANGAQTTSTAFTPASAGTYYWNAVYSGDGNNNTATSACETLTVGPASPTITTTPSATTVTLGSTSPTLKDTATLSGGYLPTGTVTFTLYHGATLVDTETVTVSGDGTYSTPTGYTLPTTGTVTGTYQWDASYSGDGNNNAASDNGAANEQVTVSPASPTLTTSLSSNPITIGGSASDSATLAGGSSPTGTITFFVSTSSTCPNPSATQVGTAVTVSGNVVYPSSSKVFPVAGTFYWYATYSGDGNNNGLTTPCGAPGETLIVNGASSTTTTTAVSCTPTSFVVGTSSSCTATVSGSSPSGTITWSQSSSDGGSVTFSSPTCTLSGGTCSVAATGASAGSVAVKGAYGGDSSNTASSGNANVVVQSPAEATQQLISTVNGMNLPRGITNSLDAKLNAALGSINHGDSNAAINQLNAFINEVQAQTGKAITQSQAQLLISDAQGIISSLSRVASISLTCDPSTVFVGATSHCEADVTAAGSAPLTGSVAFTSSDSHGTFGKVTCTTSNGGHDGRSGEDDGGKGQGHGHGATLTCMVDYTASSGSTQTITAAYSGDATHSASTDTFQLNGRGNDGGQSLRPVGFEPMTNQK